MLERMNSMVNVQNHQNFIGELHTTMIIFGRSLIRSQVFAARFFNMGCHRLRCVMVLFASGQQSPQDALFATEFQHYIGYWAGTDTELNAMKKAKKKKNQSTSKQSRISKIDLLEQFFSIVGSGYGGDSDDIVIFGNHSGTGKWTKTNNSCERNMIGNVNNLQRGVMAMDFGDLSFDVKEDDIVEVFGDSTLNFNKVGTGSKSLKEAMPYYTSATDKRLPRKSWQS